MSQDRYFNKHLPLAAEIESPPSVEEEKSRINTLLGDNSLTKVVRDMNQRVRKYEEIEGIINANKPLLEARITALKAELARQVQTDFAGKNLDDVVGTVRKVDTSAIPTKPSTIVEEILLTYSRLLESDLQIGLLHKNIPMCKQVIDAAETQLNKLPTLEFDNYAYVWRYRGLLPSDPRYTTDHMVIGVGVFQVIKGTDISNFRLDPDSYGKRGGILPNNGLPLYVVVSEVLPGGQEKTALDLVEKMRIAYDAKRVFKNGQWTARSKS